MARFSWRTTKRINWNGISIPCSESLNIEVSDNTGLGQHAGVRPNSAVKQIFKRLLKPPSTIFHHALSTGFMYRIVGRWIRQYATPATDFLEIGCGAMDLRHYLPSGCVYNAIEMAFSEYQIRHVIAKDPNVNVAFALATEIPLPDNSVSLAVATEVFEHIPPIDDAIREIHRVMKPGSKLICTIPNNFYHKYQVVGENPDHVNKWTFDGFVEFMTGHGFRVIQKQRRGYWIPIGRKRLDVFYLNITPKDEYYTSNFLYVFEVEKRESEASELKTALPSH